MDGTRRGFLKAAATAVGAAATPDVVHVQAASQAPSHEHQMAALSGLLGWPIAREDGGSDRDFDFHAS